MREWTAQKMRHFSIAKNAQRGKTLQAARVHVQNIRPSSIQSLIDGWFIIHTPASEFSL